MKDKNIVQYKGKEYRIDFKHESNPDSFIGDITGDQIKLKATTTARLRDFGKEGKIIESAMAMCSIKDQYNKHVGRVISRARLLKKLGIDK